MRELGLYLELKKWSYKKILLMVKGSPRNRIQEFLAPHPEICALARLFQVTAVVRTLGRAQHFGQRPPAMPYPCQQSGVLPLDFMGPHTVAHPPLRRSPHRDVGVTQLGPAIQVQESVDTADLAPHEPLPLGQVQGVGCVEVIDGSHHGEVCTGRGWGHGSSQGQGRPSAPPS